MRLPVELIYQEQHPYKRKTVPQRSRIIAYEKSRHIRRSICPHPAPSNDSASTYHHAPEQIAPRLGKDKFLTIKNFSRADVAV